MNEHDPVGTPIPAPSRPLPESLPWSGWAYLDPAGIPWLGPLAPTPAAAAQVLTTELRQVGRDIPPDGPPPDDLDVWVQTELGRWAAGVLVRVHAPDEHTAWLGLAGREPDHEAAHFWRLVWPAPLTGEDQVLRDVAERELGVRGAA
mgnify:CR=1 FL=1